MQIIILFSEKKNYFLIPKRKFDFLKTEKKRR